MMERKRQIEGKGRSLLSGWKEQHRCSHRKSWVGERPGEDSRELQMGRRSEGRSLGELEESKVCKTRPSPKSDAGSPRGQLHLDSMIILRSTPGPTLNTWAER